MPQRSPPQWRPPSPRGSLPHSRPVPYAEDLAGDKVGNDGIIGIDDRVGQPAALFRLLAEVVCGLGAFHTGLPQRQTASLDGRFPTMEAAEGMSRQDRAH